MAFYVLFRVFPSLISSYFLFLLWLMCYVWLRTRTKKETNIVGLFCSHCATVMASRALSCFCWCSSISFTTSPSCVFSSCKCSRSRLYFPSFLLVAPSANLLVFCWYCFPRVLWHLFFGPSCLLGPYRVALPHASRWCLLLLLLAVVVKAMLDVFMRNVQRTL